MPRLLMLLAPSSNRVYSGGAAGLVAAEVDIVANRCGGPQVTGIEPVAIAGVPYLALDASDAAQAGLDVIANVSAMYALFEATGQLLRPIEARRLDRFDDDLLTIPKYQGKTNEQFTRLLLNVTLASTAWSAELGTRRFSVLDPLAGRGTTLFQALTYGYDVTGIELEDRDVEAAATFLSTYLKRKRLKHTIALAHVREHGQRTGRRLDVEVNPDPAAFKRGDRQTLTFHVADTVDAARLFGKRRFDAIVADAPYGVVHGSRTPGRRDRSPTDLLAQALPVWARLLRPGGALGLAWNTLGLDRDALVAMVNAAGLEAHDSGPYRSLAHRVDAGIVRDIVVASKP